MVYNSLSKTVIARNSGLGIHPHCDPWGRAFSETYFPNRWRKAGSRLSGRFNYVLDGVQGDADFIAAVFSLNRS